MVMMNFAMRIHFILAVASWLLYLSPVNGKAVFAHFMVGNTASYAMSDWQDDMTKAQEAHIDAFALNMANGDPTNDAQLANAFSAANSLGFHLFFSFDYAGNGPWAQADVIDLINQYKSEAGYYYYQSQPFVSTFEGPDNADDWPTIKQQTGCFFMPSWSSLGARAAVATGVVDGLFNWAAWPEGPNEMFTTVDASYFEFLNGMPYMMPASPWFFTNLPGYWKNWLWRGDDLWYERWIQTWYLQPDFVEIITWNDYGESHYIGPLRDNAFVAFGVGEAPYNYASQMPHDGWRLFLPYVIDVYKTGSASISQEGVVSWFRPNPASVCATGGTTGNTASQLQLLYRPTEILLDKIFFSALLTSSATVTVTVGGVDQGALWAQIPDGGVGIYHGNVSYTGTGPVVVTVSRSGATIAQVSGGTITAACTDTIENWNAWVGSDVGDSVSATSPSYLSNMNCTQGTGPGDYAALCEFACQYSYCPTVCTCTAVGDPIPLPKVVGDNGCPAAGYDVTYLGLCSFGCNYGSCPDQCVVEPAGYVCSAPAVVAPPIPSCVAGISFNSTWTDVCGFTCKYGFCPNLLCICTLASYTPNVAPAATIDYSDEYSEDEYGLCQFACTRGYCPAPPCYNYGGLSTIGDPVDSNPAYAQSKLEAVVLQNIVPLISYWSECSDQPQCGVNYQLVTYGHGKVYDGDSNIVRGGGCSGGGNGNNRALCVESDVSLHGCQWYGTPKGCGQGCPEGTVLLGQNSWIGGASTGCQTGHFSSYCCSYIEAETQVAQCAAPNLSNMFTGGQGKLISDVANSRRIPYEPQGGTAHECAVAADELMALGQVSSSPIIINYVPGRWLQDPFYNGKGTGNYFEPVFNRPYPEPEETPAGCTSTVIIRPVITRITSTKTASCTDYKQACANYQSIASNANGAFDVLTCPWVAMQGRPVVARYRVEHKPVWMQHTRYGPKSCERDEYPPRAFVPDDGGPYAAQSIRLVPWQDNNKAGKYWGAVCQGKSQEIVENSGPVNDRVCTDYVSTFRNVNGFTFAWGDVHTLQTADDLLSENPCTLTITDDVGFALLTEDAWYGVNILSGHNSAAYGFPFIPPNLIPRGLEFSGEPDCEDGSMIIDNGNSSLRLPCAGPPEKRTTPGYLVVDSEGNHYTPAETTSDPNLTPTGSPSSRESDRMADDHHLLRPIQGPRPGSGIPTAVVVASTTYERSLPEITPQAECEYC